MRYKCIGLIGKSTFFQLSCYAQKKKKCIKKTKDEGQALSLFAPSNGHSL